MFSHEGGGRWRAAIISVVFAVILYAAAAMWTDAERFRASVGSIGAASLVLVLAMSAANYALRALRWRHFLGILGHRLPGVPAAMNYVAGFALTTTPGKAGEVLRSATLKRRFGVPLVDSVAALFAERFSDVMALALLACLALTAVPFGAGIAAAALAAVGLALWITASESRTARFAHVAGRMVPERFSARAAALLGRAGRLTRGRALGSGLALAVAAWAAEAWALHVIVEAVGGTLPWWTAMGIYAAALLGGAVFLLPGGLGSTEALMFALLVHGGLDSAAAGAATVASRVTTLWFAVLLGWLALPSQK